MDEALKKRIEDQIKSHNVFLYMKGTPESPMCGFSAQVVHMIRMHNIPFGSFNILEDEDIRQGVKEYSDWPTFPQLYVKGQFIGGCDIVTELHQNGELQATLEGK